MWDTGNGKTADSKLINEAARTWLANKENRGYVHEYTSLYCDVNEPLQNRRYGGYQTKERFTEKANAITDYINSTTLPCDMWFTRGDDGISVVASRIRFAGGEMPNNLQDLVGKVMQEGGFMSTASRKGKGFSEKPVIFNIYAPKGTHAVYLEPFSDFGKGDRVGWDGYRHFTRFGNEQETLFQRGTKMRITKVYENSGKTWIDCEVIGQEVKDLSYVLDENIGYDK